MKRSNNSRRGRRAVATHRGALRRQLAFEGLENRRLLAVTAIAAPGGVVSFIGDGDADMLTLFVENGLLKYSGASPDAATLNVNAADITALNIDLGGGGDSVEFVGDAAFALAQGSLAITNVETTTIRQDIVTGGRQDYLGGQLVVAGGVVTLSAGGDIVFLGPIDAAADAAPLNGPANADQTAGADFLKLQRGLGTLSGASPADGDFDGDGDVDGNDFSYWKSGAAAPPALTATYSCDGGDFLAWQRCQGMTSGASAADGDVDCDGDVDRDDLAMFKNGFGQVEALDSVIGLIVTSAGVVTVGGTVGGSTPLASFQASAAGGIVLQTELLDLAGNSVTFNSPVTLAANVTINDLGDVTFNSTVDGDGVVARSLTVNTPGMTIFNGAVGSMTPLGNLVTDDGGQTRFNVAAAGVDVRTTGDQTYNDAVTLMQDTVLAGANVTFAGTVNGTTAGLESLEVQSPGLTTFGGAVGGVVPLESLTTDMPGQTRFNVSTAGVDVRTTGDQTYDDPVVLIQDTVLAGANVTFAGTVNGTTAGLESLQVQSPGLTTFTGVVGGTVPLENLTTDIPGQTRLHTVSTLGDQTYNDPVALTAAATLAGNDVRFFDTLDGAFALTVNTSGNGSTEFHDVVGGITPLASILTNADGGQTRFNIVAVGVHVRTTGDQTYNDPVVLMQDTVLAGANVTFAGTVNGTTAESLEVRSPGLTTFAGVVGGTVPLANLTTDMPGQTRFNVSTAGVDVRTTGNQTYNDPVVLMQHTSLVSTAGRVAFLTTIDSDANGPWDLSVESAGVASFGGDVGVGRALRDLIVFTGGPFSFNVNVTAARNIDVQVRESSAASADDDLTLLAGAHLTAGGNVLLKAGDDATLVSGATIAADGTLTIDGDFGDNDPFPTTITTTSSTPMTVDAFGLLRGSAGVLIRGGNDSIDVINLQANRLASANTVAVQGYRLDAANSGSDEILLVFSPDYVMSNVGRMTISGGDEAGEDRLTIDHSKDLGRRVLEISYTTVYDPSDPGFDPVNPVIDGSNATFLGLGTSLGVDVFDVEKYVLKAGNGGHDHVLIRAADQPFPANPAGTPFQNLVQVIGVSNDGYQQWRLSGWESGELQGSNVRDLIVNDTNVPMLLQGKEGNDILVGGSSVDAIFSGPGASYDNSGNPFFFTTPNAVLSPFLSNPDPAFIQTTPLAELNRTGDALIGRDGNDFLFSDVDLFRDGPTLWGLVTLDEPGEADLLDGAGGATAATGQTDHAAQFGVGDIVRNITGMLIDGGGQKNVFTWLKAQIMQANLNPVTMTSGAVNMLIDAAFRANQPGKVGLLSPPFNAILDDFDIDVQPPPAAALPLSLLADGASGGEAEAREAGLSSPWSDDADAAFATLAD